MTPGRDDRDARYGFGVVCVLVAACFTSSAGILLRWVEAADGWQVLFYRSLSFTIVLLGFLALRYRGDLRGAFLRTGSPGLVVTLALGTTFCSYVFALLGTTVANVVFILSASPFAAALFAWIALREPVRPGLGLAMAASLMGVAIMVGEGFARGAAWGGLFALVSCFCYAVTLTAFRKRKDLDMLPAVCLAGGFATLLSALMVDSFHIGGRDLALAVALGVVQLAMQYIFITVGARHVPAAEVALLARVQVLLAPLWVWLGVGEVPATATFVGGAVVLAAVAFQASRALAPGRPDTSGV